MDKSIRNLLKAVFAPAMGMAFAAVLALLMLAPASLRVLAQTVFTNPSPFVSVSMDGIPVLTNIPNHICSGPGNSQFQDCSQVTGMAYGSLGCTTTPALVGAPDGWQLTNGASGCGSNSTIVLTMPAAKTGWVCTAWDETAPTTTMLEESADTTTSVTFQNYTRTTGVALTMVASHVIHGACHSF